MLKEEDKIFKNLYGFEDWSLAGAKKRGLSLWLFIEFLKGFSAVDLK